MVTVLPAQSDKTQSQVSGMAGTAAQSNSLNKMHLVKN